MPDVQKGCLFVAALLALFGWGAGKLVEWVFSFIQIHLAWAT